MNTVPGPAPNEVVDDWAESPLMLPPQSHPPVVLVWDRHDDAAVTHALLDEPARNRCVITVDPTPGNSAAAGLAHSVLRALGCAVQRISEQKISGIVPAWQAATAWVGALGLTRVVVLRAHRLSQSAATSLLSLRDNTGVELVLIYHGGSRPHVGWQLPAGHYTVIENLAELPELPAQDPAPAGPDRRDVVVAPVPDAEVVTFRAEAFRTLPAHRFAALDAVYREGMDAACRWMHDLPEPEPVTGFDATIEQLRALFPIGLSSDELVAGSRLLSARYDEAGLRSLAAGLLCVGRARDRAPLPVRFHNSEAVQRFLAELVADSPTRAHTITLIRGAQAGCLRHGLLLTLSQSNLHTAAGPGMNVAPFTDEIAAVIRAGVASPVHAAAVATAVFTGFPAPYLARIPFRALSPDAAIMTLSSQPRTTTSSSRHNFVVGVPAPARPLLRAARTFLELRAYAPDRPLLGAGIGLAGRILAATAAQCGVGLPEPVAMEANWHARVQAWWVGPNLHRDIDWTAAPEWQIRS
ncbi:hypothetical protein ACWFPY_25115 [Nocardia fluminea]